jgi:magnesium transporter
MIRAYNCESGVVRVHQQTAGEALPPGTFWVDLLEPTPEEDRFVDQLLDLDMPTREEMKEIELTSRLYREGGTRYMTSSVLVQAESEQPASAEITFILTGSRLVTLRYADPKPFSIFAAQLMRKPGDANRDGAFIGLLETIIDRQADILEKIGAELDHISHGIFSEHKGTRDRRADERELKDVLRAIGNRGDLIAKEREALVSLGRLITFAGQEDFDSPRDSQLYPRLKPLARDLHSLTEHANFLSTKINFMLDATLGFINIEQNAIIKIFSVAAVVFLPPTLVASIYGMNLKLTPAASMEYGFHIAIVMMIFSALLPYWFFRRKGWL